MALNVGSIITELQKEKDPIENRLKNINETIAGLQALCDHTWSPSGRKHNRDTYTCTTCTMVRES